jgi:glycosyltransferase involved in cell wall biosynthesis
MDRREVVTPSVTVVIPAHPIRVRNGMLKRAVDSVWAQTCIPDALVVAVDCYTQNAAGTRQRGLDQVQTDYVTFLDSDDEMKPQHIQRLLNVVEEQDASFVYSWFEPIGFGRDPLGHFGKPFDPHKPHHTTSVVMCETSVAKEIGFQQPRKGDPYGVEDWKFILGYCEKAIERGLKMIHLPERTWKYYLHGGNTSGTHWQGDALSVPR